MFCLSIFSSEVTPRASATAKCYAGAHADLRSVVSCRGVVDAAVTSALPFPTRRDLKLVLRSN